MFEELIDDLIANAQDSERDDTKIADLKSKIDKLVDDVKDKWVRYRCSIKLINSPESIKEDVDDLIDKLFDGTVSMILRQFESATDYQTSLRALDQLSKFDGSKFERGDCIKTILNIYFFNPNALPSFKLKAVLKRFSNLPTFDLPPVHLYNRALKVGLDDELVDHIRSLRTSPHLESLPARLLKASMYRTRCDVYRELIDATKLSNETVIDMVEFEFEHNSRIVYQLIGDGDVLNNRYLKKMIYRLDDLNSKDVEYSGSVFRCLFDLRGAAAPLAPAFSVQQDHLYLMFTDIRGDGYQEDVSLNSLIVIYSSIISL